MITIKIRFQLGKFKKGRPFNIVVKFKHQIVTMSPHNLANSLVIPSTFFMASIRIHLIIDHAKAAIIFYLEDALPILASVPCIKRLIFLWCRSVTKSNNPVAKMLISGRPNHHPYAGAAAKANKAAKEE